MVLSSVILPNRESFLFFSTTRLSRVTAAILSFEQLSKVVPEN